VLKLARAVEDALTGVLWRDDAQIAIEQLSKHYAERDEPERVRVRVEALLEIAPALALLPGQLEIVA
jgi:Holliday junction resolvase RusA-like endonuclease